MEKLQSLRYELGDLLREKPWIKWAAGAIALLVVVLLVRPLFSTKVDPGLSGDRLAVQVPVKFDDTGDTMKVPVGYVTSDLLKLGGKPGAGWKVTNPKTGQRTGTVADSAEWNRILKDVERVGAQQSPTP